MIISSIKTCDKFEIEVSVGGVVNVWKNDRPIFYNITISELEEIIETAKESTIKLVEINRA